MISRLTRKFTFVICWREFPQNPAALITFMDPEEFCFLTYCMNCSFNVLPCKIYIPVAKGMKIKISKHGGIFMGPFGINFMIDAELNRHFEK